MKTILCVIDVQPRFMTARKVIPGAVKQIKLAIKRRSPIIILEYGKVNPSHDEIYNALNYASPDKCVIEKKFIDDGSHEIINIIRSNEFGFNNIRLCGVNTCACVEDTAIGLKKSGLFNRIELVDDALNCDCGEEYSCSMRLRHIINEKGN